MGGGGGEGVFAQECLRLGGGAFEPRMIRMGYHVALFCYLSFEWREGREGKWVCVVRRYFCWKAWLGGREGRRRRHSCHDKKYPRQADLTNYVHFFFFFFHARTESGEDPIFSIIADVLFFFSSFYFFFYVFGKFRFRRPRAFFAS